MRFSRVGLICCVLLSALVIGCNVDVGYRASGSGGSSGGGGGPVSTLVITTTSPLPSGTVNSAYSDTLTATGGSGTYTWSITTGTLPAGLTLNSSTGVISGTPTTAGSSSFTVQVADSESTPQKATLAAVLVVNPAPVTIPNGTYAFVFAGTSPQGTPAARNALVVAGTFTVQANAVLSGYFDENTNTGSGMTEQTITGGTLTSGANGLGQLMLNLSGGTATFALAMPASLTSGSDKSSEIQIIEFDDTTGSGTRGSGILKSSQPVTQTTAIQGNFAFLFQASLQDQGNAVLVGSFQTDGAGNITGGKADANEEGTLKSWNTVGGRYSIDSNGRGTLTLTLQGGTFNFRFFAVSPYELMVISSDPGPKSDLVRGEALQQTGAPFSTASLPPTSVMELSGLAPLASGGTTPDVTVGYATSNGSGEIVYNFDEYSQTLVSHPNVSATYTVDSTTGRVGPTDPTWQPLLYIVNNSLAFILVPDASANSGVLEGQSGAPFANASFSGNYLGGSRPLTNPTVANESGLVAADGKGNVVLTTNRSTSTGLVQNQSITGTYAVDSHGRIAVTTPDGEIRIFYVVSPSKVVYLTNDSGGYLGSFEQ